MPEVEAKLRVADPEALRARLRALGAPLAPPREQTDLFYAHPARDFASTDEALRLRAEDGFLELTYKGPRRGLAPATGGKGGAGRRAGPGHAAGRPAAGPEAAEGRGLKSRVEVNLPVGGDATPLLEALGFRRAAILRKRRASTRVDKCRVELDEVEGLGWFLEVEALVEDERRAAAAVHATLVRLGLQDAPRIAASYLELALAAGATGATRLDGRAEPTES